MPNRSVSLNRYETGITRCLARVRDYLRDADSLAHTSGVTQGTLQNAAILAVFAVEEIGKAVILRERLEKHAGSGPVTIEARVFEDHHYKQEAAFRLIDITTRQLHRAGFDPRGFGPNFDIRNTDISPGTRLALTFIDFKDGDWTTTPLVEPGKLDNLITATRAVSEGETEKQRERFKLLGTRTVT